MTTHQFNHVGISVVSLQRSIDFYCDMLGLKLVAQKDFSGEDYESVLGLSGAHGKVALVAASNIQLELFEFHNPAPQMPRQTRNASDYGISHFCIQVADIEETYGKLKASGVAFHCPPVRFFGSAKATYGRDPDGNIFELLQRSDAPNSSASHEEGMS